MRTIPVLCSIAVVGLAAAASAGSQPMFDVVDARWTASLFGDRWEGNEFVGDTGYVVANLDRAFPQIESWHEELSVAEGRRRTVLDLFIDGTSVHGTLSLDILGSASSSGYNLAALLVVVRTHEPLPFRFAASHDHDFAHLYASWIPFVPEGVFEQGGLLPAGDHTLDLEIHWDGETPSMLASFSLVLDEPSGLPILALVLGLGLTWRRGIPGLAAGLAACAALTPTPAAALSIVSGYHIDSYLRLEVEVAHTDRGDFRGSLDRTRNYQGYYFEGEGAFVRDDTLELIDGDWLASNVIALDGSGVNGSARVKGSDSGVGEGKLVLEMGIQIEEPAWVRLAGKFVLPADFAYGRLVFGSVDLFPGDDLAFDEVFFLPDLYYSLRVELFSHDRYALFESGLDFTISAAEPPSGLAGLPEAPGLALLAVALSALACAHRRGSVLD